MFFVRFTIVGLSVFFGTLWSAQAKAAAPLHECDRLAAGASDPHRVATGVKYKDINASRAVVACTSAQSLYPNEIRFLYQLGRALTKQRRYRKAVSFFKRATAKGHVNSMVELGISFYRGEGVSKNYRTAASWFRKAVDLGNPLAKQKLGLMFVMGRGVSKNCRKGIALVKEAKRDGESDSAKAMFLANGICRPTQQRRRVRQCRSCGAGCAMGNLLCSYRGGQCCWD